MGRRKIEGNREPPKGQILSRDSWVWVEGRVFVEGFDTKKRICVDRAYRDLAAIGLVLHEQNGETNDEWDPIRRQWAAKRISLEEAAGTLEDHQNGITIQKFAKELYEEPGWTEYHLAAAVKKTYVVVSRLKQMGLCIRRRGLLFPTRKPRNKPVTPALAQAVRAYLVERGISLSEGDLTRFMKLIADNPK